MNPNEIDDLHEILLDGTAVQRAFRQSWIKTLDRHKRFGNPIVVWQDGKVVWIPAEEIQIPESIEDTPVTP